MRWHEIRHTSASGKIYVIEAYVSDVPGAVSDAKLDAWLRDWQRRGHLLMSIDVCGTRCGYVLAPRDVIVERVPVERVNQIFMDDVAVSRPAIRYPGSKWMLAEWIIEHMPPHRIYCEAYGGSGAVMLQKPRVPFEIFNDLDNRLVNLFQVMQCPDKSELLYRRLRYTLFSRREFELAAERSMYPVIDAHRTLIRGWMARGGLNLYGTSFKSNVVAKNFGTSPATSWRTWIDQAFDEIRDRMIGVTIESRPAGDVMRGHDAPDALFYVDPPYPLKTRNRKYYHHEMTDDNEHEELAETLHNLQGMVILSGYDCELYQELYSGWQVVHRRAIAQGGRERVETLWLNPAVSNALESKATGIPPKQRMLI